MRDLLRSLRGAMRSLAGRPAVTTAAILTLALGIGGTTTIFSVVDGVALRPLSFRNANRLITLCEEYPGSTPSWCSISPPNVEDITARSRTIEAIGIGRSWPYTWTTPSGPEELNGGLASPGLFHALGVSAEMGRLIEPQDLIGRPSTVAVITHEMWQSRFGSAQDIVGRSIVLDTQSVTIVGVLAPGFHVPKFEEVELWRPLHIDPRDEQHREWRGFVAYGRLRAGVSLGAARGELEGLVEDLRHQHFATTRGWNIVPLSLQDLVVGGVRHTLLIFLGAGAFVLLIACANVANLLLARANERGREMALRAALGAGRGRIIRAALSESALLALAGAILGVALAVLGTGLFKSLAPAGIPRIEEIRVGGRVLLFALVLAAGTTLLFGLAPALRAARVDLGQALREGGRSTTAHRGRLGSLLVVVELALAIVLVAGAGLLARSFAAYAAWRPGFEQEHLLTFSLFASGAKYPKNTMIPALWDRMEESIRGVPGVRSVGSASAGPMFGGRETWEVELQGVPGTGSVRWFDVSPGFFATLGLPILLGRDLGSGDVVGAPFAVLVNETLVRRYWPGQNPIGRHVTYGSDRADFTVVGLVPDIVPLRPGEGVEPQMYWSNRQMPRPFSFFVVRTTGPPRAAVASIRDAIKRIDADLDARRPLTMSELVAQGLTRPQFNMILLIAFGLTALVLAAIGTHGLLAYYVSQRTREMGIRIALGAGRGRIVGELLQRGLTLASYGIALGLVGALALGRMMASLTAGVSPRDPLTLAWSAVVLGGVATIAALLPALRASRVDPVVTLSAE